MNDSFDSPSDISCYIDSDTINDFFGYEEDKYIQKNKYNKDWNMKLKELNKYKDKLCENSEIIKLEDFYKIKKYSISKGGFLTNELRKELYKRIFSIDYLNKNNYELIYIQDNCELISKSESFSKGNFY
jgi:hypothetical protein